MSIADELTRISRLGRRGIPLTERDYEVLEIAAAAIRMSPMQACFGMPASAVRQTINLSGLIAALEETWKRGQSL